jgi:FkbM family methyltransferase
MVKSARGQHFVHTARAARNVREPLRFAARQLGIGGIGSYRLRRSGLHVVIRHANAALISPREVEMDDVRVLNEIFGSTGGSNAYDPPPRLAERLSANPPQKVLDLGANVGLFAVYALSQWPGVAVESFEADPENAALLDRAIAANGLQERWRGHALAVANYEGEMTFVSGLLTLSHGVMDAGLSGPEPDGEEAHTIRVPTTDIFTADHDVDVLKMDIEGGEWPVLADPRMSELGAKAIVLEWHAIGCPEPDPHDAAVRLLTAAGYTGWEDVELATHNGVLWAWREDSGTAPGADR